MPRPPYLHCLLLALVAAPGYLLPRPADATEAPLGRLFYTPEQRRQLENQRALGTTGEALETRSERRLNGLVRHPDGRVTTWINGAPAPGGRVAPGTSPTQAQITTESGRSVPLRVGDALPADSDTPDPLLGAGRVQRDPRRP